MMKAVTALNDEFGAALPIPLRVGIGIHTGQAMVAQIGDPAHGLLITALGETVSIASRLEAATKDFLTDCLISAQTAKASGFDLPELREQEAAYSWARGGDHPPHHGGRRSEAGRPARPRCDVRSRAAGEGRGDARRRSTPASGSPAGRTSQRAEARVKAAQGRRSCFGGFPRALEILSESRHGSIIQKDCGGAPRARRA